MSIQTGQNAVASDFITSSEKNATPTNDNGRVPKLETVDSEGAKIHRAFLPRLLQQVFSASGTYTVPTGVYRIRLRMWGAGGGGQGGVDTDGVTDQNVVGGIGGTFVEALVNVTPGDQITITIGTGGAGGTGSSSGSAGGNSTAIHTTSSRLSITAPGGKGGGDYSAPTAATITGSDLVSGTSYSLYGSGGNAGDQDKTGGGGMGGFGGPRGGNSADPNNAGNTTGATGDNGLAVIEHY